MGRLIILGIFPPRRPFSTLPSPAVYFFLKNYQTPWGLLFLISPILHTPTLREFTFAHNIFRVEFDFAHFKFVHPPIFFLFSAYFFINFVIFRKFVNLRELSCCANYNSRSTWIRAATLEILAQLKFSQNSAIKYL